MTCVEKGRVWSSLAFLTAHLETQTPPKLKVFAWRIGYNILLTSETIASINPTYSKLYPRCNNATEMLIHEIRDYDHAKVILRIEGIDGCILSSEWGIGIDWLESSMMLVSKPSKV